MAKTDYSNWLLLNFAQSPICDHDGILKVSISERSQVLTEPVEGGLLASYNKTQMPTAINVDIAVKGDTSRQTAALADLRALKNAVGTNALCTLITPSATFDRLALEEIGQSRSASDGAALLIVSLSFITVRVASATSGRVAWSPKNAGSADNVGRGRVQTKETSFLKKTLG